MTQNSILLAHSELQDLLGIRLSTGHSVREIHGQDDAYSDQHCPMPWHVRITLQKCQRS